MIRRPACAAILVATFVGLPQQLAVAQLVPPLPGGSLIVTLTSPASGSTVSGVQTVAASVSILGSLTVSNVQFKLDGGNLGGPDTSAPYSISWDTTLTGNGSHALSAVATDILGVQWNSNTVTVTVFNAPPPDTTPPTVSITSPANGATVSGTITVSASASDNVGVAGVQFLLDGIAHADDTTAPYSIPFDTTAVSNGSHTLSAVARDAAGNRTTSVTVAINVANAPPPDTTPPTVSIGAPAPGATVVGTVAVSASASDDVGVIGVQFLLDGLNLGAEDTAAPYATPWDTSTAATGTHTLSAIARDAAGNRTTSAGVTVTVSRTATVTRFEENSPAVSAGPAGAWVIRGPEVATFSGGTAGSSDVAGATATFTFNGTAVSWIGLKCTICGIATVAIDGGAPVSVDTEGPAAVGSAGLASESVFASPTLTSGTHTLVITVTGTSSSNGAHIVVDAFDVTGAGSASTARTEENNPAISATGNWVLRGSEVATFSGGAAASSDMAGATATLTFTGTGVTWIGLKCNVCGIATVSIDGGSPTTVDTAGPAAPGSPGLASEPVFTATDLAAASHTIVITVTGTTNSTGAAIVVDAFDVTGSTGSAGGAAGTTRIEDTDPAVSYTAGWTRGADSRASGGTFAEARTAGDVATLTFTGTGVSWIGFRYDGAGIARISVDGTFLSDVDTFAPVAAAQGQSQVVFSTSGLAPGTHTLTIEVTGTKNPASSDTFIIIDAFDVTP